MNNIFEDKNNQESCIENKKELNKYIDIIKRYFPEQRFDDLQFLDGSWDFDVVILNKDKVFRFPKREKIKIELQKEIILLNSFGKNRFVCIPEYTYLAEDNSFAMCEFIDGEKINKEYFSSLTELKKISIFEQLSDFINSLHGVDYEVINRDFQIVNRDKKITDIESDVDFLLKDKLSEKEIIVIKDFLKEFKKVLQHPYMKRLIHSDLHPEHLLWNESNSTLSILDFTDCKIDDPAREFFKFSNFLGQEFLDKLIERYSHVIDNNFSERLKKYEQLNPINHMIWSLKGHPLKFEEWHVKFREKFNI